ncbi:MAG: hypothetical protein L6R48_19475 [Planctomycetes bacterium]|nr:hypothetical protein [Planctomycetota bacterium]
MQLRILIPLACVALAAAAEGEPIAIANPGFEDGLAGWTLDNWARNHASAEPDTVNPHGGRAAVRIEMKRVLNQADLQFSSGPLALRPERALEVRFWARGVSNTAAITTMLRRTDAPYTAWFRCDTVLVDEWREFVYVTTLPPEAVRAPVSLRFRLNAAGVAWIDDVSVRELPARDPGPAPTANPVRNHSFEVGTEGWSATIRSREFPEAWQEAGSYAPCPPDGTLAAPVAEGCPHGRHCLQLEVPADSFAKLTSAYFPARYGHRVRLSLSLRAEPPGEVAIGLVAGKNGNARFQSVQRTAETTWQRVEFDTVLKPGDSGVFAVQLAVDRPGRYQLDDVQVVEDDGAGCDPHPPAAAVLPAADAPAGHLYAPDQPAAFRLMVAGAPAGAAWPCRWTVEDHRDRALAAGDLDLAVGADGAGEAAFTVPTARQGAFRISVRRDGRLLAEQLYSVLPPLPPPGERPESFFGGHVDLTPYNLEIARKAGFRWLRLHPPLCTKWMAVEPRPGEWSFRTAAVEAARRQGFRILGSLDTAPEHACDGDPQRSHRPRWINSYPPADLAAWQRYVTLTTRAFAPAIEAWELWNEPDGGFLQVRPGVDKATVYGALLAATREALDRVDPRLVLVGPALADPGAPLGREILARGGGRHLDGFSLHCYGLSGGGASPDYGALLPLLAGIAGFRDRRGQPLPVWHSEGGLWLAGGQSRLATWNIPPSSAVTPAQAAAAQVRAALLFKAAGAVRHFAFQAWAHPAGRKASEDVCSGYIEVTGIPGAGIAAHAALVALTEDATPAGVHLHQVAGGQVREARFTTPAGRLSAWWSDVPARLAQVAADPAKAWDLMGNPLPPAEAELGEFPVYSLQP